MTIETAIADLTIQTTELLSTCSTLKSSVNQLISSAVSTSASAAQIPLVSMATNLIDTQTLLVALIIR